MSTSAAVTHQYCTVLVPLPAGSGNKNANQVGIEIKGMVGVVETIALYVGGTTIVNPTSNTDGSITIVNIPLFNASGNSITIRYYDNANFEAATVITDLAKVGTYCKAYT